LKDDRALKPEYAGGVQRRLIFCKLTKKVYSDAALTIQQAATDSIVQDGFDRLTELRKDGSW
jgi:hypothetical protein